MVPSLALEPRLYWLPAALLLMVLLLSFPFHSVAAGSETDSRVHPLSERQLKRQQDRQRERDRLLVQAGQAFAAGQLEQAERLARRVTAQDRTDPDGLTLLAVIHAAQGQQELAGRMYQQALSLSPRRGDLLNNYGAWLCGQGESAEALVLFDRALLDPQAPLPDLTANIGICAQKSGQWQRAEQALRQALAYDPDHPEVLLAMAHLQLEHGDAMAARAFYQRRLAAAPADVSVLKLAVQVEEQLGDKAAAEHHKLRLEQAQRVDQGADAKVDQR